jgi:hypothetical protein
LNSFAVGFGKLVGSMIEGKTVMLMLGRKNREENEIKGSRDSDSAKRDFEVNLLFEDYLMNSQQLQCSIKIKEQSTVRIIEGARWESFDLMKVRFSKSNGSSDGQSCRATWQRRISFTRTSSWDKCNILQNINTFRLMAVRIGVKLSSQEIQLALQAYQQLSITAAPLN